jgi:RHS repeat-associated protein
MSAWNFTTVSGTGNHPSGYDQEDRVIHFIRNSSNTPAEALSNITLDRSPAGSSGTIGNIKSISGAPTTGTPNINGPRSYSDIYELTQFGTSIQNPGNPLGQSYNLDGQLATMHTGTQLTWDAAQRMKTAEVDNGSNGTDIVRYGYDCDGRRVWRQVVSQGGNPPNPPQPRTVFTHGGPNVIAELTVDDATNTVTTQQQYVYGTTIDELLLMRKNDGSQYGLSRNQQWSVMSAYDWSSGTIAKRYNYSLFGQRYILDADGTLAGDQNDDFGIPFGYTSRRHDAETGLMYFRARCYDPATGEFISKDPLEYVDGMSLYRGYFVADGTIPADWHIAANLLR